MFEEAMMPTVVLDLAEEDIRLLGGDPEEAGKALRLATALLLCSRGEISTGRAARLAGLRYADLLEEARRNQISLFDPDVEDLKRELARLLPEGIDPGVIRHDLARARASRS